jgi:signal transduction histidine kinase
VPEEVQPLVGALNGLLKRLGSALENERQFTGNAAHELRTPLAALRVQAQVAQRALGDEQRRRALQQIIAGVGQSAHLVDQLLTLSRLDTQAAPPIEGEIRLLEVARRVAGDMELLLQERSVSLRVEGGEDAVARGDETCIGILLRNLIDNAVRYSPAGSQVGVTVRNAGLFNRVVVTDSGPGVPDGQETEMFRRFRRGVETKTPGSGLGLSIVRRIVELHGGSVHLENRKEGGLRCEVRLPLWAAGPAPPRRPATPP